MLSNSTVGRKVEFIGGPFDGLVELLESPAKPFLAVKVAAIAPQATLWRRLLGLFRFDAKEGVRVSIYELTQRDDAASYRYLATQTLSQRELAQQRSLITLDRPLCGAK